MKKALITGAEGFVGKYLIEELKQYYNVIGTFFIEKQLSIESYFLDITDKEKVQSIIERTNPDTIYHLAAQSSGGNSFKQPYITYKINIEGTLNIIEAIRNVNKNIKLIIPSSADVYGVPEYLPIDEKHPVNPQNPYSSSKAIIEKIAIQYIENYNLNIVITRSFNHTGIGQDSRFFIPSIIEKIKKSNREIYVGNIDIKRDFLDVRDVVKAYRMLANATVGVYNVSSGRAVLLRDIIEFVKEIFNKNIDIIKHNDLTRENEPEVLYGTYEKINREINWRPEIDIMNTIKLMCEI